MTVLNWEKPEQIMPKEDWLAMGFDDGPPGAYVPNMSREDRLKWKAKFIGGKYFRVEIRKSTNDWVQMLIVVSLSNTPTNKDKWRSRSEGREVGEGHGVNVKLSMNGTACFTFEELNELTTAVAEAQQVLVVKAMLRQGLI
jgi:hypothetical protein